MTRAIQAAVFGAMLVVAVLAVVWWWPGVGAPATTEHVPVAVRESGPIDPTTSVVPTETDRVGDAADRAVVESNPAAAAQRFVVVRGFVVDLEGEPIASTEIRANEASSTTADEDGMYEVAVRVAEDQRMLLVEVWGDGWAPQQRKLAIDGDELVADFALRPGFVIEGRVVDAAGNGIEGATVRTFRRGQRPVETDEDGNFRLADLDPEQDQHYVEASKRGYVAAGTSFPERIEPVEELVLELSAGAIVRGVVLDTRGAPLPGAYVRVLTNRTKAQWRVETLSGNDGRFEFAGLPSGRYPLAVTHDDHAAESRTIDVPAPGEVLELTIGMSAGRALRGLVRDGNGAPVEGASVRAFLVGKGKGRMGALREVESDATGAFELAGLPLVELRLECRAPNFVPRRDIAVDAAATFHEIVLAEGAGLAGTVVDARTGQPVTSFLVRLLQANGKPRATGGKGGKAAAAKRGGGRRILDELGHWDSGEAPLPAGQAFDVEIRADGYAAHVAEGLVARIRPSYDDHRIELTTGVAVVATVANADGSPLVDGAVRIAHDGAVARATATGAGRFVCEGVTPGEVRVIVDRSRDSVFVHRATIPDGVSEWSVEVRLTDQGAIHGVVREPDGRHVPDARVLLTAADVPGLVGRTWSRRTNAGGRFEVDDLPVGTYRVARTEKIGERPVETYSVHVEVSDRTPVEVELVATGIGRIRGTVVSGYDDVALPPTLVVRWTQRLEDEDSLPLVERVPQRFARANHGALEFFGLPPGPCTLMAYGYDDNTGSWIFGSLDVDVLEAGDTPVELVLDGRK